MYLALCSFTQKRLLVRLKFQQSNEIFISLDCAIFKGRFTKTQRLKVKPLTRVTASSQRKAEQITVLFKFTIISIKCTDKNTNITHDIFIM